MSEYRIDKIRHAVAITLVHGHRIEGDLFLQASAPFRAGPEDPLDLLNNADRFLPVAAADGEVLLVQKSQVAHAAIGLPRDDDTVDRGVVGMHVELTLVDGSAWSGSIFPELRDARPRLVDFLNESPLAFIALFAHDRVLLVNRRHVAFARAVS
ncbi:MAG: hypothetical protein JWM10_5114 [Myxococcaceae bacterium]|nr:hypothetical protein [Myxococcaceae bacterium]